MGDRPVGEDGGVVYSPAVEYVGEVVNAPGETVRVRVTGWMPDTSVNVRFNDAGSLPSNAGGVIASTNADASGVAEFDVTLPSAADYSFIRSEFGDGYGRWLRFLGAPPAISLHLTLPELATEIPGFYPVDPARVFDTRGEEPQGLVDVTKQTYGPSNGVLKVKATEIAGVPADGVGAVSLNVTITQPESIGHLTVYPCTNITDPLPDPANLNYIENQSVPNAVITPVSDTGEICFSSYANTHIVADINGWFNG